MTYRRRLFDGLLDVLLVEVSAVALAGPKAGDKTATAQQRAKTVYRLDDALSREAFVNASDPLGSAPEPVLIDEWQHVPDVWNQVR